MYTIHHSRLRQNRLGADRGRFWIWDFLNRLYNGPWPDRAQTSWTRWWWGPDEEAPHTHATTIHTSPCVHVSLDSTLLTLIFLSIIHSSSFPFPVPHALCPLTLLTCLLVYLFIYFTYFIYTPATYLHILLLYLLYLLSYPGYHTYNPPDTTICSPHWHTPFHTCSSRVWSLTKAQYRHKIPHLPIQACSFNFQHRAMPQ